MDDIPAQPRRAAFLDRDGTLNDDVHFLCEPSQVRLLPGVPQALRILRKAGFLVIVATNQSGVARGLLTEETLDAIHREIEKQLERRGAKVDAFYYCPHLPEGTLPEYARECDCRKPAPGLLLRAADELGIDLKRSVAIGDSERDVAAGRAAGCRTALISKDPPPRTAADAVFPSLLEASGWAAEQARS